MVNLLGDLWADGTPDWSVVLDEPRAKLHLYGKSQARPGRKMGHLTVTSQVATEAVERALELRRRWRPLTTRQRWRTNQRSVGCRPSSMPRRSKRVTGRNVGRSISPPVSRSSAPHASCITLA